MRRLVPSLPCYALLAAILVAVFVGHGRRIHHVDAVTAAGDAAPAVDPDSITGYADGVRHLVVPARNAEAMQWIVQTQQMLHEGSARIRHVTYDNAPTGRPVYTPSPFRWWLAAVAAPIHLATGQPMALAVERTAVWSEPLLHVLIVVGAAAFILRRMGPLAAVVATLALAFGFPFAGMFQAGAPEDAGLTHGLLLASLLVFFDASVHPGRTGRLRFGLAGALAATALWLNPGSAVPIVAGLGLSGLILAFCGRRRAGEPPAPEASMPPWRTWGVWGAGVTFAAYLLEFAPGHLSWSEPGPTEVHPLYAIAWLGLAELIHRANTAFAGHAFARGWRGWIVAVAAVLALLSLPVVMVATDTRAFLQPETFDNRLTPWLGGIAAEGFPGLVRRDGLTQAAVAAFLPLLLLLSPLGHAINSVFTRRPAPATVLLLGPGIATGWLAWHHLSWWSGLGMIATLIAAALAVRKPDAPAPALRSVGWIVVFLPVFGPGLWLSVASQLGANPKDLSEADQQTLVERDLAHWLAQRVGPEDGTVLAPPQLTASLIYFGGLRGLGSPYRENRDGFGAAVRICAANSADEAEVLVRQRALTHIVMPSWDPFLREYARLGTTQVQSSLIAFLESWLPPRWLRPAAYQTPPLPLFARERANVFEVTEVQDQALALSRLADYFVEMGDTQPAAELSRVLAEKFPEDISVQTAIAKGQLARGERFLFAATLKEILVHVSEGAADYLPWDRRVSLALVLAAGKQLEEAREQVAWCTETATDVDLRQLAMPTLAQFAALCDQFSLQMAEPELERLMRERVPAQAASADR